VVSSEITNPTEQNREAVFNLQIPEKAFISNFSMVIDGELIVTEVKAKEEADRLYEEARQKNQTAGKVSSSGPTHESTPLPGMEQFRVSIAVKANSSIQFQLTYLQLLERVNGMYEQVISMRPGQIVPDFRVDVYVYDKQNIKDLTIFEPSLSTNSFEYQIAEVKQLSPYLQHVKFYPTPEQQRQMNKDVGVDRDLIISYDVEHEDNGGLLQVEGDKYFAHYFSPREQGYEALNKHIAFVIDISGSMSGRKMSQTRDAFRTILSQLRSRDTFLLLLFDDITEVWPLSEEPLLATSANINEAQRFAEKKLYARGGTNIASAVVQACNILRVQKNPLGSSLVMFLTDGQANVGVTNVNDIVAIVTDAAAGDVAVFSLAFGNRADFELLEKLAYRTGGNVHKIYEEGNAVSQLTNFYSSIGTPLMYNVAIEYPQDIVDMATVTDTSFKQHFRGSEIVVVGQLISAVVDVAESFEAVVTAEEARRGSLEVAAVRLSSKSTVEGDLPTEVASQEGFIEKLYVYLRIKHLLKEILLTDDVTMQKELEEEALELALKYRFVTPLTSMIIVQDEADYDVQRKSHGVLSGSSKLVPAYASGLAAVLPGVNIISFSAWYLTCFLCQRQ